MPVGCGRSDSRCLDAGQERRDCGGLSLMHHTLLLQIFPEAGVEASPPAGQASPLSCPTCKPFSEICCQAEAGWSVLSSLVRTNMNNVWNIQLVKTMTRLRYQVSAVAANYILSYHLWFPVSY